VHGKIFCAITKDGIIYSHIGTGNYNEDTAKIYTDFHLLTANPRITTEVFQIFKCLFERKMYIPRSKESTLYVSPGNFRDAIFHLIEDEMKKHSNGKIMLKCNSLCDGEVIDKLYSAAEAGVQIKIICRTGCSIMAHQNISIRSKVGRFLEHDREYIFGDRVFISSADLLLRNISKRVETLCEIKDIALSKRIINNFDRIWNDKSIYSLLENGRWDKEYHSLLEQAII
jgi:polyphosphate kinase